MMDLNNILQEDKNFNEWMTFLAQNNFTGENSLIMPAFSKSKNKVVSLTGYKEHYAYIIEFEEKIIHAFLVKEDLSKPEDFPKYCEVNFKADKANTVVCSWDYDDMSDAVQKFLKAYRYINNINLPLDESKCEDISIQLVSYINSGVGMMSSSELRGTGILKKIDEAILDAGYEQFVTEKGEKVAHTFLLKEGPVFVVTINEAYRPTFKFTKIENKELCTLELNMKFSVVNDKGLKCFKEMLVKLKPEIEKYKTGDNLIPIIDAITSPIMKKYEPLTLCEVAPLGGK